MRRFALAGALMTAVALAAATAASAAVPSPSYQLGGFGFGSSFVGTGVGSAGDRGFWQATIAVNPATLAVTGGTFSLRSNNGSQLTGSFTGGTTAPAAAAPGCGRQQVAVTGQLTTSNGPMIFTGNVTQFRVLFRGTCTVLASQLQGSLAPNSATPPGDGGGAL